jgi:D-glycero-beta-D-manno-heptose 1-phosphate adenylyltransferase
MSSNRGVSKVDSAVSTSHKVVTWDVLLSARRRCASERTAVVWTNGCFDLLHLGHVRNLEAASSLGDVLVVGVNSDLSVRQLKGSGRPIVPENERAQIIAALACVAYVILFDELTPEAAIARLQPDVHTKGADYAPPHGKPIPEARIVTGYGGRIEFLPLLPALSTTDLVRRVLEMNDNESRGNK